MVIRPKPSVLMGIKVLSDQIVPEDSGTSSIIWSLWIQESPSKDEVKESGSGGGMSSGKVMDYYKEGKWTLSDPWIDFQGIGMVAAGMAGAVMAPACAMVKDGEGGAVKCLDSNHVVFDATC